MLYASPVSFAHIFAFDVCSIVLGHWALFGSVLTHSELELYTVCLFFFLAALLCKECFEKI